MPVSKLRILSSVFCCLFFVLGPAKAQSIDYDGLKGLEPFRLLIENVDRDAMRGGVTISWLEAVVRDELKAQGFKTTTKDLSPYLYINVNVLYVESLNLYTYSVTLKINQPVYLPRNAEYIIATTYDKGLIGTTGGTRLQGQVDSAIRALVRRFAVDFTDANLGN